MIRRILAHIIANSVALYFVTVILEGNFSITGGWQGFVIAGILFGFLNGIVKPILKLISLPFVFLSMGLFIFLINTFLVWFAEYCLEILDFEGIRLIVEGGFFQYLLAGFLISIFNGLISWLLKK